MLPVSQLVRVNGQAVARADIESKPSPPNFFSSFPPHQEAAGAVVKQLVWALISTSHRGHPVTEPTYSHHSLNSDLSVPDITAAELTPSDACQIRELVATVDLTYEARKAAEALGPCSAHSHSKALWPPSAVHQSAGTSDQ